MTGASVPDDRDYPAGFFAEAAADVSKPPLWRVGNHQRQNLYHGDRYEGVMFRVETATLAAAALNHLQSGTCDGIARAAAVAALRDFADECEDTGFGEGLADDGLATVLRERANRLEADDD